MFAARVREPKYRGSVRRDHILVGYHILQYPDQRGSSRLKFLAVSRGQRAQGRLALIRQAQQHLPAIDLVAGPGQQPTLLGPIDERHGTVVLNLQALGDIADGDLLVAIPFDGEQQLMLLGLESGGAARFLAEALELAELIAKFRENPVIWRS